MLLLHKSQTFRCSDQSYVSELDSAQELRQPEVISLSYLMWVFYGIFIDFKSNFHDVLIGFLMYVDPMQNLTVLTLQIKPPVSIPRTVLMSLIAFFLSHRKYKIF